MGEAVNRHALTDAQWERIADLFPGPAHTGRPAHDHRLMFEGMLWLMRTGIPWRDLPRLMFGPWQTVYDRFNRWQREGRLDRIRDRLLGDLEAAGELDHELWCIDGSNIRAARAAAGGGKKGARKSLQTTR
jgi:transposase